MWNLKIEQIVTITKKKQGHRYRDKLVVIRGVRVWGRGSIAIRDSERKILGAN